MTQPRVALIVSTFPPYRGGMGNAAAVHARLLSTRGMSVTVYTPDYGQSTSDAGLPYKVVRLPALLKFGNAAFVPKLHQYIKDEDLIFFHYPFFGAAEIAMLSKKPMVVFYHMDAVGKGAYRFFFALYRWLTLALFLRKARKIFVSSLAYAQTSCLNYQALEPKIVAMPYSVDTLRFAPSPKPSDLLSRYGCAVTDPIALFVGSLDSAHYFKGIAELLHAWQKVGSSLPRAKLLIVGSGSQATHYEQLARQLDIQSAVFFVSNVSDEELPHHYQLADVHILPSIDRSEAFGLVTLEAMATGRPSIVSRLPGVADLVREGETGWVVAPGDVESLAQTIVGALGDSDELRRRGERAREIAISYYSEAVCGDRLAAALKTALL